MNTHTVETDSPFAMAGLPAPGASVDDGKMDASASSGQVIDLAARRAPHDRLPVVRRLFGGIPPKASLYHTQRAEDARQLAETEVTKWLAEARRALIDAGLRRGHEDTADVADHNAMTLAYALAYAECGLHVIDAHAVDPQSGEGTGRAGGTPSAKIPRGSKWGVRASDDPVEIVSFWTGDGEYPETQDGQVYPYARVSAPRNVSITFPPGCFMFVLDEDGQEGMEAVRALEAEHGALPRTAESISGSGVGRHRIFRCKRQILNTGSRLAPKVDVRGEGGQIIAAPSVHATGGYYTWKDGCAPWDGIADAPEWLEELAYSASAKNAPKEVKEKATRANGGPLARSISINGLGFAGYLADIGDGEGQGGFHYPIYSTACSWWGSHPNGDAEELHGVLRDTIDAAPRDTTKDRSKYFTDWYLLERIDEARRYIAANREEDDTDPGTHRAETAPERVEEDEAAANEVVAEEREAADAALNRTSADADARAYFREHGLDADKGPLLSREIDPQTIEVARRNVARQIEERESDKLANPVAAEKVALKDSTPTPRILAPLHDERLVDGSGFLIKPDTSPRLYREYRIDPTHPQAYIRMRLEVRDQMTKTLMERFQYVVIDGDAKLAIRQGAGEPVRLWKEATLANIYKNRAVSYEETEKKGSVKLHQIKPADCFLYERGRNTFVDTCFEPDPALAASAAARGEFNIWTGFAVQPVKGDWSKLRDHIRDNVCSGDIGHFNWFMTWLASSFARPGVKVPSTVAVLGEQGTGKSKVFDWVRKAIGCAALKVSSGRHLTGNFNAHLDGKIFLTCEEAFWAGDKSAAGVMKDLISSATIQIEGKFAHLIERPNYIAIVFISNNDWAVPVDGEDARRFFVLRVSNARKEDSKFFGEIDDQMENGGVSAMLHELMHWKPETVGLSWNSLRTPPKTDELKSQVAQGLEGPMAHLVNIFENGVLSGRDDGGDVFHYDLSADTPTRVARTHLTAAMKVENGRGNKTVEARKAIAKLLGDDAWHENKAIVTYHGEMKDGSRIDKTTTDRVRYLDIPALDSLAGTLARYGRG